ncbi:EAL domain-containing protein [Paraburkholderia heleia]|uniref:EAL domain-containing protein n=1 Tax=Paraburkholderia heleia TaxID=634127 RepID=UPI002AB60884|nr:EAL domain-containing protein [Paraburkholderia heleia]
MPWPNIRVGPDIDHCHAQRSEGLIRTPKTGVVIVAKLALRELTLFDIYDRIVLDKTVPFCPPKPTRQHPFKFNGSMPIEYVRSIFPQRNLLRRVFGGLMCNQEEGLLIQITNVSQIVRDFGRGVANGIAQELAERAQRLCGKGARVVRPDHGRIRISWFDHACERYIQFEPEHRRAYAAEMMDELPRSLSSAPVEVVLCADWQGLQGLAADGETCCSDQGEAKDLDRTRFVYEKLAANRLELWRQPVCSITSDADVLYQECLSRVVVEGRKEPIFPGEFIPGMERLGLVRALDLLVVGKALGELQDDPLLRLGVNISGLSAIDDIWWASTLRWLEVNPAVAKRLVIEITETAPLHIGASRRFCGKLRGLGCRVAVDDFGAGFGVKACIEIQHPDIVKIDSSILRLAAQEGSPAKLRGMVAIAEGIAEHVVLEGIESERDLALAYRAGVKWVQGHYLGVPQRSAAQAVALS